MQLRESAMRWCNERELEVKESSGKTVPMRKFRSVDRFDKFMGLAYTSSSSCAGLWVCNVDVRMFFAETWWTIRGFVMTKYEDGRVFNTVLVNNEYEEELSFDF